LSFAVVQASLSYAILSSSDISGTCGKGAGVVAVPRSVVPVILLFAVILAPVIETVVYPNAPPGFPKEKRSVY
jgi:hypothetical protein